jgi:hypothetical protein
MIFLPLFRPFIMSLEKSARGLAKDLSHVRVDESLDNGHSALGELLLGVSTGSVGWKSVWFG